MTPEDVAMFAEMLERVDFSLESHVRVSALSPRSPEAQLWVVENIPDDATFFDGAVIIEFRFVQDVVNGILRDGLSVAYLAPRAPH